MFNSLKFIDFILHNIGSSFSSSAKTGARYNFLHFRNKFSFSHVSDVAQSVWMIIWMIPSNELDQWSQRLNNKGSLSEQSTWTFHECFAECFSYSRWGNFVREIKGKVNQMYNNRKRVKRAPKLSFNCFHHQSFIFFLLLPVSCSTSCN